MKNAQNDKALSKSWQLKEANEYADMKMANYTGYPEHRQATRALYVERYLSELTEFYYMKQAQGAKDTIKHFHKWYNPLSWVVRLDNTK